MNCIFCKIAEKEAPAEVVHETEDAVVFENIRPLAPIHLLAIPKRHIASVDAIEPTEAELVGQTVLAARDAARKKGLDDAGYKLAVNVGEGGGQEIFHLHFHILGGWKSKEERDIPEMP